MLVPVIGIIQISPDAAHADRYTYLPEIGLAIAAIWAVADGSVRWKQRRPCGVKPINPNTPPNPTTPQGRLILGGLMAAVIGALMICAHAQTSYWKNNETLWTRALACTSGNSVAHNNIGYALYQKGDVKDAISHYKQALENYPNYAEAHYNLGVVFLKMGELDDAIAEYKQALKIKPDYMEAHFDLGAALALKGNLDEAVAQYRKVLEIRPDYPEADYNLGKVLLLKGDLDGAMACLDKTTAASPDPRQDGTTSATNFCKNGIGNAPLCAIGRR